MLPAIGAAELCTGADGTGCTTADFTHSVEAVVYYIDPEDGGMQTVCPTVLYGRSITDGRAMVGSTLTLTIGIYSLTGDEVYGKIHDICFCQPTALCSTGHLAA